MGARSRALAVAAVVAVAAALVAAGPPGRAVDRELSSYLLILLRGPVEPPDGVVIIAQDKASEAALGQTGLEGWPRRDLARVVQQASAAGARALALDLVLRRRTADDAEMATALGTSGRVVLAEKTTVPQPEVLGDLALRTETALPPLPVFATAAALTAPHPVTSGWLHVPAFWAFKPGAGGRPTLPAAALLVAALADGPARDALAVAAQAEAMPAVADLVRQPGVPLAARIKGLRPLLAHDHSGAERLRARLAAGTGGDEPSAARIAAAATALLAGPSCHLLVPYGPAGRLPRVSYGDVEAGDPVALAALRARIAFVGATDLTERVKQQDSFPTVFARPDGIEMAGVEVAATATLNLLNGDAAMPAPRKVAALLAGSSAALAALAGGLLPPLLALTAVLAAGGAVVVVGMRLLAAWHVVLPLASTLLSLVAIGLPTGLLVRQRLVREQLDRAVAALTRNRVRRARPLAGLEGMAPRKVRWAACLATDLTDYVGLTEALAGREPDLADLVARYRAVLHETVERSGGYVLNLAGDASICLWEAAGPDRGARERAARAALELVGALDRFAAEQGLLAGHLTRAGLAAGWVVLGNFAQGGRFSFAGVGEPLNLASRLEQLNKQLGTRILAAAEAVADLDGLPLRPLGAFRLKGVAQPQEVVALDPTPAQGVQSVTAHARLR